MAEQQLKELISSLKNQLQDENDPRFLENLIPDFFTSTEKKIAKLTSNLSEADVNYSSMVHLAYEIKGEASYLACAQLANVSKELGDASNAQNKDECLRLLDNVKSEYYYVKPHLNRIAKLERAIYENQQAGK